ncbi:MAG TPA: hypothetical protein PKJ69_10080 [Spirochaetota bacterium]|jgi:hypothetical protein|nr:hypothetical protein [Spirochaetota bacterium]
MIVDKTTTDSYLTDSMEEMKKAKIRSYFDLISILRDHPDWLDELRKLILTEELINLPKKFDEFVKQYQNFIENEFKPLKQTVQKQGEDIAVLKEDVAVLKEDVAVLKQDVGVLKSDVGDLKGDSFERKVRERAPSYFGKIIRKCKLISHIELANILDDALDAGIIGDDERDDALLCDVVVTGALRNNKERKVLIVAEVSVVVDKQDVERAASRTKVIEKCMGLPGIPVVIGKEHTEGSLKRADELQVIVV